MNSSNSLWVTSPGGPVTPMPEYACPHRNGAPDDWPEHEGGYRRVRAVDGYIGLIEVGSANAQILGNKPASTTFHHERNVLIRAAALDDDTDHDAILDRMLPAVDLGLARI